MCPRITEARCGHKLRTLFVGRDVKLWPACSARSVSEASKPS